MTHPSRLLSLCAALTALMALPAAARPPVPIAHPAPGHRLQFDPKKFMRISQLRPGMRGYALTVFQGTKIEKFGIQILGIIKKYNQGKDYILFKATSGPSVTEHLNIAHGMSGSPIYIHGKMIGAISMEVSNGTPGPSFGRDPIGLATPIEEMFDAWSPDLPSKPNAISAGPLTPASGYAAFNFQPIDLPVTVSGMTLGGIARLNTAFAPFHLNLMAGGGGGTTAAKNLIKAGAMLKPGAAVGVSLMQGDMDFTATGTVTYRDGNRVLLFGHPFFGLGPVDAALTTASVAGIYPSYEDSVKLGQPLQTVGRIFQDRPFSVGGIVGSLPQMIPMTVSVNDLSIKRRKDFHVRIINHPLLTSQLVLAAAGQAIAQVHGLPGDSMATVTMDVNVEEIGHVRRTNTFYDAVSIDQAAVGDLQNLMQLLSSNPFYPLSVKSIKMGVTIQNRHDTAEVDHIFLRQSKFAPGDVVSVGVVLKPYKHERLTRDINLKIPANTPNGTLTLSVEGGGEGGGGMISLGGLILMTAPAPTGAANTVAQLVKQFAEKPRNNELVAHLTLPTSAIDIDGEKLTNLPPTLASVMRASRSSGLHTERDEVKVVQPTPYLVTGSESLTITVQKKDATETSKTTTPGGVTPPAAPSASSASTGDDAGPTANQASSDTASATESFVDALPLALTAPKPPPPAVLGPATPSPGGTGPAAAVSPSTPPTPASGTATAAATTTPVKAVGRLPTIWRQDSMTDFAAGDLKNVSVTSLGDVRLSASLQKLADTPETYVWSILPDGRGNAYVGTGDRGIIYKMTSDGKLSPFFKTGQLEVTALATDGEGIVYAGTAPHGIVYRITPDGKGMKFLTAQEKYVTALAFHDATLFVATGGGTGRVYAAPGSGLKPNVSPLFTSPEADILSLAVDKSGSVYAGSSPNGIVYKITPQGQSSVFYDATEPNISALATDSTGNVYVGTQPQGSIYKITPDGTAKLLSSRATSGVLSLRTDGNDNLYACSGNTIYRIAPDETMQTFTADADEQFVTLAVDSGRGQVYAGTSTVGSVYSLGGGGTGRLQGQFQSVVHDAGLPSHWGTLAWTADTPPGTHVVLQTRSGDVPQPDTSWSAWSPADTSASGQTITSPPARYLQYQALLTRDAGAAPDAAPKLRDVTVYYLTRNQPPTVHLLSPAPGAVLHKATLLQWSSSDPDSDTLSYDLSYSSDSGKTWTPIKKRATPQGPSAVPPTPPAAPAAASAGPVTDQEVAARVAKMVASLDHQRPGLPPDVRARLIAQATETIRHSLEAQRTPTPAPANTGGTAVKETSFSWDTTEVPDGNYQVRVIASDKPSNPQGALTAQAVSSPLLIANTPPTLTVGTNTVNADKTVTVHGIAQTKLAFVRAVQGHADSSDDVAALADDGLFDSTLEPFTLTLGPLSAGVHAVEVQAIDQAGNATTAKVRVTVP